MKRSIDEGMMHLVWRSQHIEAASLRKTNLALSSANWLKLTAFCRMDKRPFLAYGLILLILPFLPFQPYHDCTD